MPSQDRKVALGGLALSIVYLGATMTLPKVEAGDPVGPAGFPILLGVALFLLSVGMLLAGRGTKAAGSGQSAGLGRYQEVFDSSGDTPDPTSRGLAPAGHPRGLSATYLAVAEGEGVAFVAHYRTLWMVLGWLAFYALTFDGMGYLLSTSAAGFGLLRIARRGSWLVDVAVAVGFGAATQLLFSYLLAGGFPHGWLEPLFAK